MRIHHVVAAIALSASGCESKPASPDHKAHTPKQTARAPLVDLTSASSLGAVRAAFNAHKGEARFLTLLSPT